MICKWMYAAMILIKMIYRHSLPSEIWFQVLLSYFGLNIKLLNNFAFRILVNGFEERQNRTLMGIVHALIKCNWKQAISNICLYYSIMLLRHTSTIHNIGMKSTPYGDFSVGVAGNYKLISSSIKIRQAFKTRFQVGNI